MTGTLTNSDLACLRALLKQGPISCANLGELIWRGGICGDLVRQSSGWRYGNCSCPFARPAGRIVRRLLRLNLASQFPDKRRTLYVATSKGEQAYRKATSDPAFSLEDPAVAEISKRVRARIRR